MNTVYRYTPKPATSSMHVIPEAELTGATGGSQLPAHYFCNTRCRAEISIHIKVVSCKYSTVILLMKNCIFSHTHTHTHSHKGSVLQIFNINITNEFFFRELTEYLA